WKPPPRLDMPPSTVEHGYQSVQRDIQKEREQCVLQELFFSKSRWTQNTQDNFNWTRHWGATSSLLTGPSFDHTVGDCFMGNGATYRGHVNTTDDGLVCQRWEDQTPHEHEFLDLSIGGLSENYCRNPDDEKRPWCYTLDPSVRWQYCPVKPCDQTGYYIYIKTSSVQMSDKARLRLYSPTVYPTSSTMCLRFWYHMYGRNINRLNVYIQTGSALPTVPTFQRIGPQGDRWIQAEVDVYSASPYQVWL
ncbi:PREDICTED: hepatocyte growth factor-like, partial [Branchiostoma belcheri]|uniref:Hepatocyte growth factor-like n=1 Tax=Branchiostoma belcheri TaxID=7741 RepID=A0A6P4ZW80_BRABE